MRHDRQCSAASMSRYRKGLHIHMSKESNLVVRWRCSDKGPAHVDINREDIDKDDMQCGSTSERPGQGELSREQGQDRESSALGSVARALCAGCGKWCENVGGRRVQGKKVELQDFSH